MSLLPTTVRRRFIASRKTGTLERQQHSVFSTEGVNSSVKLAKSTADRRAQRSVLEVWRVRSRGYESARAHCGWIDADVRFLQRACTPPLESELPFGTVLGATEGLKLESLGRGGRDDREHDAKELKCRFDCAR